ncbi:MAG: hypothetical protein RIR11_2118 [Bacteroidota bacterium]|jgi:hypothetical protein
MAKSTSESINWVEGLIAKTFGLKRVLDGFPLLDAWLTVENDLDSKTIEELEKRRLTLRKRVNGWNEETLKMKFIAFILDMVAYDTDDLEGVFDAELKGIVQDKHLSVVADYALCSYTFDFKEQPYFYFHEYKPRKKSKDPFAQLLLAMLIAQSKNEVQRPLYSCAVVGENWYFMILDEKTYSISNAYVSTNADDLQTIFLILRKFKDILATELSNNLQE